MSAKRVKSNIFWIGFINNLIFISIYYYGYVTSGYQATGDSMGGYMMVYGLILFLPQTAIAIYPTLYMFLSVMDTANEKAWKTLSPDDWMYYILFFLSLMVVVLILFS